jgi:hypothetical protein
MNFYRHLLKRSWEISWNNRLLWIFGLFSAIIIGGGSSEYQIFTNTALSPSSFGSTYISKLLSFDAATSNFFHGLKLIILGGNPITIVNSLSLMLLVGLIFYFFIWMGISSQIAIVDGVSRISASKKAAALDFRKQLGRSRGKFWPTFFFNLIGIVLTYVLFLIPYTTLFLMGIETPLIGLLIYVISFIVFIPVAMGVSLLFKYAICYTVIEDEEASTSIIKSYKLLKKNWLVSLETAVMMFVINFLASLLAVALIVIVLLPIFVLGLIIAQAWITIGAMILAIIAVTFFGAFITVFHTAVWTDLFLELNNGSILAKLERIFRRL